MGKDGKRKTRRMRCPDLTDLIYEARGWDKGCRYKINGYMIDYNGETIYVFDLMDRRIYQEKTKNGKTDRKGYLPDDIANTFGIPVEEHDNHEDLEGLIPIGRILGLEKEDASSQEGNIPPRVDNIPPQIEETQHE